MLCCVSSNAVPQIAKKEIPMQLVWYVNEKFELDSKWVPAVAAHRNGLRLVKI